MERVMGTGMGIISLIGTGMDTTNPIPMRNLYTSRRLCTTRHCNHPA